METEVVWVDIDDVKFGLSPRKREIDETHVSSLAELEGRWPPILLARQDGRVIDGHHRVAVARLIGWAKLPAVFFDGTADEGFVEAVRRNVEHGLPLTANERKAAALRLIRDHPDWSDRRVAQVCALSSRTVAGLRPDTGAGEDNNEYRIGRDGRVRPTRPGSRRPRIVEAVRANPDASLRVIARAVGASPETVRRVRQGLLEDKGPDLPRTPRSRSTNVVALTSIGESAAGLESRRTRDSALMSSPLGKQFVNWFERTDVSTQWRTYIVAVPLSRVYEVADEARRRARMWAEFADLVEQRTHSTRDARLGHTPPQHLSTRDASAPKVQQQ